jgi:methyl-accepting chemotaxis protein
LAERSQKAAGEINQLSASTVKVAERAGELLEKLVPNIQKTAELVQEITAASNEQNTGAEQINTALQQLQNVIQQNASAAEEMAGTSNELSSQANQMLGSMNFFQLVESASRPAQAPVSAPPRQRSYAASTRVPAARTPRAAAKKNGKDNGFSLAVAEPRDKLDHEFERY